VRLDLLQSGSVENMGDLPGGPAPHDEVVLDSRALAFALDQKPLADEQAVRNGIERSLAFECEPAIRQVDAAPLCRRESIPRRGPPPIPDVEYQNAPRRQPGGESLKDATSGDFVNKVVLILHGTVWRQSAAAGKHPAGPRR
jgi:hypothetical protein